MCCYVCLMKKMKIITNTIVFSTALLCITLENSQLSSGVSQYGPPGHVLLGLGYNEGLPVFLFSSKKSLHIPRNSCMIYILFICPFLLLWLYHTKNFLVTKRF